MRNHEFHFDKDNQMLTITKSDCSALMASAATGKEVAINWDLEGPVVHNDTGKTPQPVPHDTPTKPNNTSHHGNGTNATDPRPPAEEPTFWTTPMQLLCNRFFR